MVVAESSRRIFQTTPKSSYDQFIVSVAKYKDDITQQQLIKIQAFFLIPSSSTAIFEDAQLT